jgi:hypothetical protein
VFLVSCAAVGLRPLVTARASCGRTGCGCGCPEFESGDLKFGWGDLRFGLLGFLIVLLPLQLALIMASVEALEEIDILLLPYATLTQPPYLLAGVGLAIGILCGLTFSKLVQLRLEDWKQDRLPLLPLARLQTVLPWVGLLLGITLFIGGSLQVFGFAPGAAILVAFLLSLATGGALWVQLVRLMRQVQSGNFKAVDFDNFDEFFG